MYEFIYFFRVVYIQPGRMMNFVQRYDWSFALTAPKLSKTVQDGIKTMHNFTIKVIEERRAALEQSIANGNEIKMTDDDFDVGRKQKMALLDILLQSSIDGKPLSNADIQEEVDTFMFEGDDTTTSAVSHALYYIARKPEVQRKLYEEIVSVMGNDKDAPITMKDLNDLKYMECVAKEIMRLHPPVPSIGRKTNQDINLSKF